MNAQGGRYEIDQRWLILDFSITEKFCFRDVSATAMGFDALPIIYALQDVFAIFGNFQFDHRQPAVVSQCQQVNRPDTDGPAARRAKLRMQWRDDQTRIEFGDVATQ